MSSSTEAASRPDTARLTARDLMTRDVLTAPPTMPVEVVARMMADRHVSGLPVVDPGTGELLGIVTESDLIRRVATPADPPAGWLARLFGDPVCLAERYLKGHGLSAADVMTPIPLAAVEEDASAADVAQLLEQRGVRRVPVLRNGVLVGIVSRADLLRAVLQGGASDDAEQRDERIEREVMVRMRREPWNVAQWLTVRSRDGVVQLHGFCNSDVVRHALCVLAQGVEGVHRVEDRMESLPYPVHR